jgi:hypothetical protein
MPFTETTSRVKVSTPSRRRTDLNIGAAVLAVIISLVILALLAGSPSSPAHRHEPRTATRGGAAVTHGAARP